MKIVVNGKEESIDGPMTVRAYVDKGGINPERIVVELNREMLGKDSWMDIVLKQDDELEILGFVGGGKGDA